MTNTTIEKASKLAEKTSAHTPNKTDAVNHQPADSKTEDNSLLMVRDILFGEQKRQHEQRIVDLELLIENYDQKNRKDMANDFDILNTEIRLLNQLLADENKARLNDNTQYHERFKQVTQQHLALSENMQKMFTQMSAKMTADIAAMKKEFFKEQQELMNFFEEETTQLKKDKADRKILADTFAELAKQLDTSK